MIMLLLCTGCACNLLKIGSVQWKRTTRRQVESEGRKERSMWQTGNVWIRIFLVRSMVTAIALHGNLSSTWHYFQWFCFSSSSIRYNSNQLQLTWQSDNCSTTSLHHCKSHVVKLDWKHRYVQERNSTHFKLFGSHLVHLESLK